MPEKISKNIEKQHEHKSKHCHHKHQHKHCHNNKEQIQRIEILQQQLNNLPYKCENCNQNQACCYCQQCQHLFCQQCYQKIHIQALKDHIKITDLKTIEQLNKQCQQHQTKYTRYCLTCQQFLCEICVQQHNQLHQIVTISQAQDILKQTLNQHLQVDGSKQIQQLSQIYQNYALSLKITEQDYDEYAKQVYTRCQQELNILKRLKTEKMNEIESFKQDLEEKLSDIRLLQQKQLQPQTIEQLHKYIDKIQQIEQINPQIYQIALNNYSPHIDWKQDQTDQRIQLLTSQLESLQLEHQKQIRDYQDELVEYEKLMTKYSYELGEKTLFCLWCGKPLNSKIINQKCQHNLIQFNTESEKLAFINKKVNQYQCQLDIKEAQEQVGNQQHYWIQ